MPFFWAAWPCSLKDSFGSSVTPSHLMWVWGARISEPKRMVGLGDAEGVGRWEKSSHWLFFLSKAAPCFVPHRSSR